MENIGAKSKNVVTFPVTTFFDNSIVLTKFTPILNLTFPFILHSVHLHTLQKHDT